MKDLFAQNVALYSEKAKGGPGCGLWLDVSSSLLDPIPLVQPGSSRRETQPN